MKVFDSIIFLNELDLLEMRLNILNDVVDYFVVTESPFTVSGNEKPLYYAENKDRFGKFNDKIIHHITEEIPNDFHHMLEKTKFHAAYKENATNGIPLINVPIHFQRAVYNRNNSAFGIAKGNPKPEDLIITSDADEIIDPRVLKNLDWFDPNNFYVAMGPAYYFKLNFKYQDDWRGPVICNWFKLNDTTVDSLRQNYRNAHCIEDAAWHFSFLGDIEKFKYKIKSYEHCDELGTKEIFQRAESGFLEKGLDVFGRGETYEAVPIDDSYPEFIRNNQEKYKELIAPWN